MTLHQEIKAAKSYGHRPDKFHFQCSKCPLRSPRLLLYTCECGEVKGVCKDCLLEHLRVYKPKYKMSIETIAKRQVTRMKNDRIRKTGFDDTPFDKIQQIKSWEQTIAELSR